MPKIRAALKSSKAMEKWKVTVHIYSANMNVWKPWKAIKGTKTMQQLRETKRGAKHNKRTLPQYSYKCLAFVSQQCIVVIINIIIIIIINIIIIIIINPDMFWWSSSFIVASAMVGASTVASWLNSADILSDLRDILVRADLMSNTLEKSNQERGHVHFTGCCQKFQGWNGSNFFRLHRLRLLGIDR